MIRAGDGSPDDNDVGRPEANGRSFDFDQPDQKLPFPTRPLRVQNGVVEEYIIPDDKKQEVLEQLCIFSPVPSLDDELYDLHEGKTFVVRDFRVTWENGHNWLVSPYYPSSGGTVIDWVPPEFAQDDEDDDEDEGLGPDEENDASDGREDGDEDDLDDVFGIGDKDDEDDEADHPNRD